MTSADEAALCDARLARASRLGSYLGALAWRGTVTSIRALFVVPLCAWLWHAIVPGIDFWCWVVVFVANYLVAWPCGIIWRTLRRAAGRTATAWRAGSGFGPRSRVLPPL